MSKTTEMIREMNVFKSQCGGRKILVQEQTEPFRCQGVQFIRLLCLLHCLLNVITALLCSGFVAESVFLYYAQEIVCLHDFTVPYHRPSRTNLFDSPIDLMWSLAPKPLHSKTCNFMQVLLCLFTCLPSRGIK